MIQISVSELKANLSYYVSLAQTNDVFITKHGKPYAKLTTAKPDKISAATALFGVLPSTVNLNTEREERLNESGI